MKSSCGRDEMSDELKMSVSCTFTKDGEKKAYVSFSDDTRSAEALIPDCRITSNKGFTDEEVGQLSEYLKAQSEELMKMAAGINVMDAFMGKQK